MRGGAFKFCKNQLDIHVCSLQLQLCPEAKWMLATTVLSVRCHGDTYLGEVVVVINVL